MPSRELSNPIPIIREVFVPDVPLPLAIVQVESILAVSARSSASDAGLFPSTWNGQSVPCGIESPDDGLANEGNTGLL